MVMEYGYLVDIQGGISTRDISVMESHMAKGSLTYGDSIEWKEGIWKMGSLNMQKKSLQP
jgi:hypothetical protein